MIPLTYITTSTPVNPSCSITHLNEKKVKNRQGKPNNQKCDNFQYALQSLENECMYSGGMVSELYQQ